MRAVQPPPFGLRIAAILCAGAGFYGLLGALGVSVPLLASHRGPWLPLVLAPIGQLLICGGAILVWLRHRLGVLLLVIGWALPAAANQYFGGPLHLPGMLVLVGFLLIVVNVKHLR